MPAVLTASRRVLAVLVAVLVGALLTACGSTPKGSVVYSGTGSEGPSMSIPGPASPSGGGSGSSASAKAAPSKAAPLAPAAPVSGLGTMLVSQLPKQGVDTLRLIVSDGPFPYSKDGVTFSNREGLLPQHKSGWYREFTVITPGSSDRGARRIIAGDDGGRFYTDDHYASFREVLSGVSS